MLMAYLAISQRDVPYPLNTQTQASNETHYPNEVWKRKNRYDKRWRQRPPAHASHDIRPRNYEYSEQRSDSGEIRNVESLPPSQYGAYARSQNGPGLHAGKHD